MVPEDKERVELGFRIGPLDFVVSMAPTTVVGLAGYESFISPAPSNTEDCLKIRTETSVPPQRKGAELIAELPQSWLLYKEDDGYWLEILEQAHFKPRLIVTMDQKLKEATLYLGLDLEGSIGPFSSFGRILGRVLDPFLKWWLCAWLSQGERGFIFHASAVRWEDRGFLFVGPSGAGKTTLVRLWHETEPQATVLNDERIIVWRDESGWMMSGTPWPGMFEQTSNQRVPLTNVFILKKGEDNRFVPLGRDLLFQHLIQEALVPLWDSSRMAGFLETMQCFLSGMKGGGELTFTPDDRAVAFLKELPLAQESTPHMRCRQ